MNDNKSGSEHKPIIITRPRRAARRTADQLRAAGAAGRIMISPLVKITAAVPQMDLDAGFEVVFTSENGVLAAPRPPAGMTAWCIGERTAAAARVRGFAATAADGNAESLIALLRASCPKKPLIWLRGRHSAVDIEARLLETGVRVRSAVVYGQTALQLSSEAAELLRSTACVLPVYSPRTAAILSAEASGLPDPGHAICCLSGRVRDSCGLGWKTETARNAGCLIQMTVSRATQGYAGRIEGQEAGENGRYPLGGDF